ncbi:6-phosphofructo-2-kinase / fructose-2,6-bisphosphatase [Klebsormidium nitens]|uniref:6-phosphofructo-2-kinase / fructose-2,6-bisphosphatase n=1 Tax=Klebsormidium nitens TaxID=105231 RepID=A0A1Y1IMD6_KLENI|nr:6-phosphofructo-2-kinase / fructose-2,6-bisphosphatase [Klebsormidium nitens]|eukprot:GAQ89278.1 6-phosphofructo-2-kinase / fructose-2,6-bisphosphatase [Klebsormidium nitens]
MTSVQQCLLTVQLSSGVRPLPPDFVPHLVAAPLGKEDGPVFAFGQQPMAYNQVAGLWHLAFIAPQNAVGGFLFSLTTNSTTVQETRDEPRSLALYLRGPPPTGDSASFSVGANKTDSLRCTVVVAAEPVSAFELGGCLHSPAQDNQGDAFEIGSPGEDSLLTSYDRKDADSPTLPYLANSTEEPRLLRSISEPARAGFNSLSRLKSAMGARVLSVKDLLVLEEGSEEGASEEEGEEIDEPGTATSAGSSAEDWSPPYQAHSQFNAFDLAHELDPVLSRAPSLKRENLPPHVQRSLSSSWEFSNPGSPHKRFPVEEEDQTDMPAAAGAVAAAAISERMDGPKEKRKLAIILVGLPARGKSYTAAKLTQYLRWLGHETKHFNVGSFRRQMHGAGHTASFFDPDNDAGQEARREAAVATFQAMLKWFDEGGQVACFDATNSSAARRRMLLEMAEGRCKAIFLESICDDASLVERNIREKVRTSPDYADWLDKEAAVRDLESRIANYQKAYEPVNEGSCIKLINMVHGSGGQIHVKNISGYLPGRIVFYLVNVHITARPIFLTRHGESQDNVEGRIGGDPPLSSRGEAYAPKLAEFLHKRLKQEPAASVWTSTLQRTLLTARYIVGYPKVQWRALDEIAAGVCDGMTYGDIKEKMPEEHKARKRDKLRYRYPAGESYLDVIQRLEPVIIELERQRSAVVIVAHQAVLRALYGYFADKPLKEVPHIDMPLHTLIELVPGVGGMTEKRYNLLP